MGILSLEEKLDAASLKRKKDYENIQQLRRQRDDGNTHFFQSHAILNKACELAAEKDINALEELSQTEVEKFMSLWNSDKSFRDEYEKRILPSLDMRQLSAETDTLPKQPKEEINKSSSHGTLPTQKVQKETKSKGRDLKSNLVNKDLEDADEYEFENPHKDTAVKEPEIDPEKLRAMKREEELVKAKDAVKRKRKLAWRAAAKKTFRAQKEAEKKLKEREKKAKKAAETAAASGSAAVPNSEEPASETVEVAEQEKINDKVEAAALAKDKKVTKIRSRTKGPEAIPKAIIKRRSLNKAIPKAIIKRSQNFVIWIVASFALLILVSRGCLEKLRFRRSCKAIFCVAG